MKILDGSPGFGAPLNEQETLHFLATGKLNVHLGTVDEKGYPNVHPAWYYYDSANNGIYVETSTKQGKKTDNLRNDGNVYSSIDDPNPPYRDASRKGSVKIHENVYFNVPIAEKIMVLVVLVR